MGGPVALRRFFAQYLDPVDVLVEEEADRLDDRRLTRPTSTDDAVKARAEIDLDVAQVAGGGAKAVDLNWD
jgi:hypothetical protein